MANTERKSRKSGKASSERSLDKLESETKSLVGRIGKLHADLRVEGQSREKIGAIGAELKNATIALDELIRKLDERAETAAKRLYELVTGDRALLKISRGAEFEANLAQAAKPKNEKDNQFHSGLATAPTSHARQLGKVVKANVGAGYLEEAVNNLLDMATAERIAEEADTAKYQNLASKQFGYVRGEARALVETPLPANGRAASAKKDSFEAKLDTIGHEFSELTKIVTDCASVPGQVRELGEVLVPLSSFLHSYHSRLTDLNKRLRAFADGFANENSAEVYKTATRKICARILKRGFFTFRPILVGVLSSLAALLAIAISGSLPLKNWALSLAFLSGNIVYALSILMERRAHQLQMKFVRGALLDQSSSYFDGLLANGGDENRTFRFVPVAIVRDFAKFESGKPVQSLESEARSNWAVTLDRMHVNDFATVLAAFAAFVCIGLPIGGWPSANRPVFLSEGTDGQYCVLHRGKALIATAQHYFVTGSGFWSIDEIDRAQIAAIAPYAGNVRDCQTPIPDAASASALAIAGSIDKVGDGLDKVAEKLPQQIVVNAPGCGAAESCARDSIAVVSPVIVDNKVTASPGDSGGLHFFTQFFIGETGEQALTAARPFLLLPYFPNPVVGAGDGNAINNSAKAYDFGRTKNLIEDMFATNESGKSENGVTQTSALASTAKGDGRSQGEFKESLIGRIALSLLACSTNEYGAAKKRGRIPRDIVVDVQGFASETGFPELDSHAKSEAQWYLAEGRRAAVIDKLLAIVKNPDRIKFMVEDSAGSNVVRDDICKIRSGILPRPDFRFRCHEEMQLHMKEWMRQVPSKEADPLREAFARSVLISFPKDTLKICNGEIE
jgi:hypothetical protein